VFDAVILAGGAARRLAGQDKPALSVGGVPMLDRVITACAGATTVVVVGPRRPTVRDVVWTREQPPGGGPVAGLAAGVATVTADRLVLLAADLPWLTGAAVTDLSSRVNTVVTVHGRAQWLCSVWEVAALRRTLREVQVHGARLGPVLRSLTPSLLVPTDPQVWQDVDTEDDLARARGSG
jgi:molybdopterin-guanine dinucleotide biosynthesis protein A